MQKIPILTKDISPRPLSQSSILGLDRKKMEQERLSRLAQRKRKMDDKETEIENPAQLFSKRAKVPIRTSTLPSRPVSSSHQSFLSGGNSSAKPIPTIKYPKGAILRTYSRHHPRQQDITIEEVLQKDHLKTALVSSYTFNLEWFFKKLNTKTIKLILVMSAKGEEERGQWSREALEVGRGSIRVVFPPLEGQAPLMHSKLMLLRYDHSLRIVVTSANVELYDWGESGVMENSVFIIDLPELENDEKVAVGELTYFAKELRRFLNRSNVPDTILDGLLKFDFSKTKDIAFVYSAGGASFGSDRQRTGFNSLAQAVAFLGLAPPKGAKLHLNCITASLGSLSDAFLNCIYKAASGKTNTLEPTRVTKSSTPVSSKVRDYVRVLFPSEETVNASTGGPDNAGTVCFHAESYNADTFPKGVLRDYVSIRRGMLSHAKTILAYTTGAEAPSKNVAWVLVGSANLTESAWGRLVKDRARKEMKLVCRHWECGVIVPVPVPDGHEMREENMRELFKPVLDIPCEIPGKEYVEDGDPWFFTDKSRWN
jgi:hypothetical protein